MPYIIKIKQQAKRKLKSLSRDERKRITDKLQELAINPDSPKLDVKQMEGSNGMLYRLRVGDWRVVFARFDTLQILSIEKIGPRGDVYK